MEKILPFIDSGITLDVQHVVKQLGDMILMKISTTTLEINSLKEIMATRYFEIGEAIFMMCANRLK